VPIISRSCCSYLWERVSRSAGRSVSGQDGDSWSGSHLEGLMTCCRGCRVDLFGVELSGEKDLGIS
jgi:hypothetical protein